MRGFWVGRGEPASVDWCEANYAVTTWVAEFHNTWTSLAFAVFGLYGLYRLVPVAFPGRGRVLASLGGLVLVGLGSAAFHGTLLRLPQAFDELPMVWFSLVASWAVIHRRTPQGGGLWSGLAMTVFGVGFTWAYFRAEAYFTLFISTYASLIAFVALRSAWVTWVRGNDRVAHRWLAVACGGFFCGLFFAWVPEHLILACDHPLQALQLHGWWHLLAGIGVFTWTIWLAIDRAPIAGRRWVQAGWFVALAPEDD